MSVFERFGKVVRQDTALFVQSPGDDEVVGTGDPLQVTHIALQLSDIQLEDTDVLLEFSDIQFENADILLELSDIQLEDANVLFEFAEALPQFSKSLIHLGDQLQQQGFQFGNFVRHSSGLSSARKYDPYFQAMP
jgi:hypothetical protein